MEQGDVLSSCFSSHTVASVLFMVYLVSPFSNFCLWVISLFKMALKCTAEVLSSFSSCKRAVRCLMEKTCVLDKSYSSMSYSAVSHQFNVNESTIYMFKRVSLNRTTPKTGYIKNALKILSLDFPFEQ